MFIKTSFFVDAIVIDVRLCKWDLPCTHAQSGCTSFMSKNKILSTGLGGGQLMSRPRQRLRVGVSLTAVGDLPYKISYKLWEIDLIEKRLID